MSKLRKNLLLEIAESLSSISLGRDYPQYEGFSSDAHNLRSDWNAIGSDMRLAIRKEKQHHNKVASKNG